MLESTIGENVFNNIIRELYTEAQCFDCRIAGADLYKKVKKVVGKTHARDFFENWVWSTSCPELELRYSFNKRSNSIELTLTQTTAVQKYFRF